MAASAPAAVLDAQDKAPAPRQTGGFDGQRAYDYTAKLVSFGPHPSGSDAIKQTQNYIYSELHADGCKVDEDDFHARDAGGNDGDEKYHREGPGQPGRASFCC